MGSILACQYSNFSVENREVKFGVYNDTIKVLKIPPHLFLTHHYASVCVLAENVTVCALKLKSWILYSFTNCASKIDHILTQQNSSANRVLFSTNLVNAPFLALNFTPLVFTSHFPLRLSYAHTVFL